MSVTCRIKKIMDEVEKKAFQPDAGGWVISIDDLEKILQNQIARE